MLIDPKGLALAIGQEDDPPLGRVERRNHRDPFHCHWETGLVQQRDGQPFPRVADILVELDSQSVDCLASDTQRGSDLLSVESRVDLAAALECQFPGPVQALVGYRKPDVMAGIGASRLQRAFDSLRQPGLEPLGRLASQGPALALLQQVLRGRGPVHLDDRIDTVEPGIGSVGTVQGSDQQCLLLDLGR